MAPKRKPPPGNVRNVLSFAGNHCGIAVNKNGELVQFESWQEYILILLFEKDITVFNYTSQPETFEFYDRKGRKRHYTPDFKVIRTDGSIEYHEVTVQGRREDRESLQDREENAHRIFAERGHRYVIHTDVTLPRGFELQNLDSLSAFRVSCHSDASRQLIWIEALRGHGKVRVVEALRKIESTTSTGLLMNTLFHMIWHGKIEIFWDKQLFWRGGLDPKAEIWLPK